MAVEFTSLIACIIGPWDYSFTALLRKTRECFIAISTVDLARKVVDIGNCSGEDVDKFVTFKLTPLPTKRVSVPLVDECLANIECKMKDTRLVNKYGLFILEGAQAWIDAKRKERRTFHVKRGGRRHLCGRRPHPGPQGAYGQVSAHAVGKAAGRT